VHQLLSMSGIIAGYSGALVCFVAGSARIMGHYVIGGYESTTLFSVGTGLMVYACFIRLEAASSAQGKE
jgi:hypothetical protein